MNMAADRIVDLLEDVYKRFTLGLQELLILSIYKMNYSSLGSPTNKKEPPAEALFCWLIDEYKNPASVASHRVDKARARTEFIPITPLFWSASDPHPLHMLRNIDYL